MADNESIVKIKTEGDTSGAEKVEKAIDKIGDAAEKAAELCLREIQPAQVVDGHAVLQEQPPVFQQAVDLQEIEDRGIGVP